MQVLMTCYENKEWCLNIWKCTQLYLQKPSLCDMCWITEMILNSPINHNISTNNFYQSSSKQKKLQWCLNWCNQGCVPLCPSSWLVCISLSILVFCIVSSISFILLRRESFQFSNLSRQELIWSSSKSRASYSEGKKVKSKNCIKYLLIDKLKVPSFKGSKQSGREI